MDAIAGTRLMIVAPNTRFVRLFLAEQIDLLVQAGFEVHLLCAPYLRENDLLADLRCTVTFLQIPREISLANDSAALMQLLSIMRAWKPAIVHGHGPKPGLLASATAWLCGVPVRLHTIHGLRSDGLTGARRAVVRTMERLTFALSTQCFSVSHSLSDRIVEQGLLPRQKAAVLRHGSWAGVSLDHFCRLPHQAAGTAFREHNKIAAGAVVISCIGRLAKDKGIQTLAEAWQLLSAQHPEARLLIAGPPDSTDPLAAETLQSLRSDERVILQEHFIEDVATLLAASDIFVQPSLREGLGVAALEAAAMELPVVAARVTGLVDTVRDKVSGYLFKPQDAASLAAFIGHLLLDPESRTAMGQRGRKLVRQHFSRTDVLQASLQMYSALPRKAECLTAWNRFGKRAFDLAVSLALLALAAPLLLLVAAAIWVFLSRPVLFMQLRAGLHGRPIRIFKFRTMKMPAPGQAMIGTDELRTHWLGSLLRKLSLDELPQLFNVVRGEMSLIGPRPLLLSYLPRYSEQHSHRHDVVPGITGWAQVNGRNSISWEHRFDLDLWYVSHRSAGLDLKILLLTLRRVLLPKGITPNGQTSMPEFLGASNQAHT